MGFRSDDSGPAFEVSLFEEILCVLAGVFDLVKIGLSDGEWFVHGDLVFEGELSAGWEQLDWDGASAVESLAIVVESNEVVSWLVRLPRSPSGKDDCLFAFTPGELTRLHFIHWNGSTRRVV